MELSIEIKGWLAGEYLFLQVKDDGPGFLQSDWPPCGG